MPRQGGPGACGRPGGPGRTPGSGSGATLAHRLDRSVRARRVNNPPSRPARAVRGGARNSPGRFGVPGDPASDGPHSRLPGCDTPCLRAALASARGGYRVQGKTSSRRRGESRNDVSVCRNKTAKERSRSWSQPLFGRRAKVGPSHPREQTGAFGDPRVECGGRKRKFCLSCGARLRKVVVVMVVVTFLFFFFFLSFCAGWYPIIPGYQTGSGSPE